MIFSFKFNDLSMKEVRRAPRRTKAFTLDALKTKLGKLTLKDPTPERLIQIGKARAKERAGLETISMDIGYIKLIVSHAAAVHGTVVQVAPIDLARIALKRLGLVGKGRERVRPTSLPARLIPPHHIPAFLDTRDRVVDLDARPDVVDCLDSHSTSTSASDLRHRAALQSEPLQGDLDHAIPPAWRGAVRPCTLRPPVLRTC